MQKDYILPISILVAGVLVAGSVIYSTGVKNIQESVKQPNQNSDPQVSLELNSDDVVLGDISAPVTIIEYADLQCPFCARFFSQSENQIRENFIKTGKAKMVSRHFAFLGEESFAAAEAVECAKDQGKSWNLRDSIYEEEIKDGKENNGNLNANLFVSFAKKLGMDTSTFSDCLAKNKYSDKIKKDYDGAVAAGVQSTPTIFINNNKIEGAVPFSQISAVIESFLK